MSSVLHIGVSSSIVWKMAPNGRPILSIRNIKMRKKKNLSLLLTNVNAISACVPLYVVLHTTQVATQPLLGNTNRLRFGIFFLRCAGLGRYV